MFHFDFWHHLLWVVILVPSKLGKLKICFCKCHNTGFCPCFLTLFVTKALLPPHSQPLLPVYHPFLPLSERKMPLQYVAKNSDEPCCVSHDQDELPWLHRHDPKQIKPISEWIGQEILCRAELYFFAVSARLANWSWYHSMDCLAQHELDTIQ